MRTSVVWIVRSLLRGAELATTRFPVATLLVIAFSILANAEVARVRLVADETLSWWIVAVYSGAVASVVAKLVFEALESRPLVGQVASLVSAILIGGIVRFAEPLGVFAPALVAAVSLAVPLSPYMVRPSDRQFWTFTLWTGVGIVLAFLSVLLFTLGVSAILEMVRFLFDVGLGSKAYLHMYTTALTLVGPLIALGRIPADFDEALASNGQDRMGDGVRLLFDWVAAPLALATAIVLHLYAAKILTIGGLPRNEVGWIVTSFALLVLSMRIGAEPFLATGRLFARIFARAWAVMLVVPLGLLAIAIAQRVGPEGWTLERYYLALGALAVAQILVAQAIPAFRGRIRLMAAGPLLLLALSSAGPLGVGDTVAGSQVGRLSSLTIEQEGRLSIMEGRGTEARSRIAALAEVDRLDRAVALLPEAQSASMAGPIEGGGDAGQSVDRLQLSEDRVAAAFGAAYEPTVDTARGREFYATMQPVLIVAGYDVIIPGRSSFPGAVETSVQDGVGSSLDGDQLVLRVSSVEDRFSLSSAIEALPASSIASESQTVRPIDIALRSSNGRMTRLVIQSLSLDPANHPTALSATILLRRGDWPDAALFGGNPEAGGAEPGGTVGQRPR